MTALDRLALQTDEENMAILEDCLETAKNAIMSRRFPYGDWPDELENRYADLQYRIALDLYNKRGAEGQLSHGENGISRGFESSWISMQLLSEIVPTCGVTK